MLQIVESAASLSGRYTFLLTHHKMQLCCTAVDYKILRGSKQQRYYCTHVYPLPLSATVHRILFGVVFICRALDTSTTLQQRLGISVWLASILTVPRRTSTGQPSLEQICRTRFTCVEPVCSRCCSGVTRTLVSPCSTPLVGAARNILSRKRRG